MTYKEKIEGVLLLGDVTKAERLIYEWTATRVIGMQMFFELLELVKEHVGTAAYDRGYNDGGNRFKVIEALSGGH